jgi:hypothetical protein
MSAADEITTSIDRHFSLSADQRQAMSNACWTTARQMTIAKNVEQTLDMFEEVLREKLCA